MTSSAFHLVSVHDARRYCSYTSKSGPLWLRELAHHMAETGGPIDDMDASFDSLSGLWEWHLSQAELDLPGIGHDVVPVRALFLGWGSKVRRDRVGFAVEPFAHYIFEIMRRVDPGVYWDLNAVPNDAITRYRPAAFGKRWDGIPIDLVTWNQSRLAEERKPISLRRSALFDVVVELLKPTPEDLARPSSGSILSGLLESPRPTFDALMDGLPRGVPEAVEFDPHPERENLVDEDFVFASPLADPDRLDIAPALDETLLARGLTALGAHIDGVGVRVQDLRGSSRTLIVRDQLAVVEVIVEDRQLRGFVVQPLRLTPAEWDATLADFHQLALRVGAQFSYADAYRHTS